MNESLKSQIAAADPARELNDAQTGALVRRMSVDAYQAASSNTAVSRVPWLRRRPGVALLAIGGALTLTGAAVAIPLTLWVGGTQVDLDAKIPIAYTTDTGVDVTCEYGIYFGNFENRSEADEQLARFVHEHDWSGIGQRIYDEAIANPFTPGAADDWDVDTQALRDRTSFIEATDLIWNEIPVELQQGGQSSSATMNCTGQLH